MTAHLDRAADDVLAAATALVGIAVRSLDERAADLTLVQYRCLVVLAKAGATATTALSSAVGVHQSTATRATDGLVRRGLASKQRDPGDRRLTVVALTDAGAGVVDSVMRARRALIRQVLATLPRGDALDVGQALARFAAAAERAGDAAPVEIDYSI